MKLLILAALLATVGTGTALAQEKALPPQKNQWVFQANNQPVPPRWLYVTIKAENGGWVIDRLERTPPENILKESSLEPFIVSPDFQRWSNYYTDRIGNCESFALQDSPFKSVCFSQFAGKNTTKALVGLLFGGSGVAGQQYDAEQVNQAITRMDPEEALRELERIERSR